ncbi:MAG: NAD(P)H:quinone oxidoreductase [Phycisphaerae bacterium]|nr:NAD(P)H:quinone oxidoreductase [Tepidisphaeraceae bacterium]
MPAKVQIIFYSMYGHIYRMAEAVADGARSVAGTEVELYQVKETLPDEVLTKMGAAGAKKSWAHVPFADAAKLAEADAVILGIPTRFGLVVTQMQTFLDQTGQLWAKGALVGKVGSSFASTATQHGGQETTLVASHTFFFHQGMVVVGVPYAAPGLSKMDEVTGGTPYGATTLAGPKGDRQPTANELELAKFQGAHVARIAGKLAAK